MNDMMNRLNQIMNMVRGRDPEQVFKDMARQRGLSEEDMKQIISRAESAAKQMGFTK